MKNLYIIAKTMKLALIFRCDTLRQSDAANKNRNYIDALLCWNNWKKTLVEDLSDHGHVCDIAFITYSNEILDKIRETIRPKFIELHEKNKAIHEKT